jgi:YegS/Rv2252/BmrU family lipid kinase
MPQSIAIEQTKYFGRIDQKIGLVIHNPVAGDGNSDQREATLSAILDTGRYELYETTGDESLRELVREKIEDNEVGWVAAIGGDGTVSQVAEGLVGTDIPLAIIPAGTGNVLARELGIPQDLAAACRLLAEQPAIRTIDSIQIGRNHYFLQVGVGLESIAMKNTSSEQKNRWGMLAYLQSVAQAIASWRPHTFELTIDGKTHQLHASELVIANARQIGVLDLAWHDAISVDDGRLDVAVVEAYSVTDYIQLLWSLLTNRQSKSKRFRFFEVYHSVKLNMTQSLPIHGDGELLDVAAPFTMELVPGALHVVVPTEVQS